MARACRKCGCTEITACMTDGIGCWWVQPDLCSNCLTPAEAMQEFRLIGATNAALGAAQLLTTESQEPPAFPREAVTYLVYAATAAANVELFDGRLDDDERETLNRFVADASRFIEDWVG